jgi:hypothetical protein
MKNLLVSFLFSLVSLFSFSQKMTVHVTEVKDYVHSDSVSYIVAMNESRSDNDKRTVDGTYNIDLDAKSLSFKTLKNSGTRTINSYTKSGNTIRVNFTDDYLEDENGNKLEVTLVINQKAGKVVFTYFDPIYKYTFAQDFTKNEISMNK